MWMAKSFSILLIGILFLIDLYAFSADTIYGPGGEGIKPGVFRPTSPPSGSPSSGYPPSDSSSPNSSSSGSSPSYSQPFYQYPSPQVPSQREIEFKRESTLQDANARGVAFYNVGEYRAAIEAFQEALETNPDDEIILRNIHKAETKFAKHKRLVEMGDKIQNLQQYLDRDLEAIKNCGSKRGLRTSRGGKILHATRKER